MHDDGLHCCHFVKGGEKFGGRLVRVGVEWMSDWFGDTGLCDVSKKNTMEQGQCTRFESL